MKTTELLLWLFILFSIVTLLYDTLYKYYTRILCWNIEFFGLINIDENVEYYHKISQRIKYFNPDIICLQEVSSMVGMKKLLSYLPDYKLYIDKTYYSKNTNFLDSKTFESLNTKNIHLNISNLEDKINSLIGNCFLVKKTIQVKSFEVIDQRLILLVYYDQYLKQDVYIYNIHLPSDYSINNSEKREKKLEKIHQYINVSNQKNVIIAGDFNTNTQQKDMKIMCDNYYDTRYIVSNYPYSQLYITGMNTGLTHTIKNQTIDYFFVNKNMKPHVRGMFTDMEFCDNNIGNLLPSPLKRISDHCPIILDIN